MLKIEKLNKFTFCEDCVLGKFTRMRFKTAIHQTKQTLDYIHYDLWGLSKVASHSRVKYFLFFIDDFFKNVSMYILKNKSDTYEKFKERKNLVKNLVGKIIKRFMTENGLKYLYNTFSVFCKQKCIITRHRTVRDTRQQNSLTKKMNKTILEKVKYMFFTFGLSKTFWV